jgi:hypothetical protein
MKSRQQKPTEMRIKDPTHKGEIHRQLAAYRKSLHGQRVNEILGMGGVFQLEALSYRGFQR